MGEASSSASWDAALPLMSQRAFPLAVGGGFYYGGRACNSRLMQAPFRGEVAALAIFRRRLSPAERAKTQRFLADRYFLACAALAAPPGAAGACAAARNGAECAMRCAPGLTLAGGSEALTCANGAWAGLAPVCAPAACAGAPPAPPAGADARACSVVLASADFARAGAAAALWPAWETLPALPTALAAERWAPGARGLVGSAPPDDDDCSALEPTALVLNRPRAAAGADPAAPVTVLAELSLDAGAVGGALARSSRRPRPARSTRGRRASSGSLSWAARARRASTRSATDRSRAQRPLS